MPAPVYSPQQAGRIGGLIRAATAPTRQDITSAANARNAQKYLDQARELCPEVTDDAELARRAHLLLQADMTRLSARAAAARRLRAQLRKIEDELEAEQDPSAGTAA